MKPAQPEDGHRWLQQLVGEWTFESDSPNAGESHRGTERVRRLGDLWVVGESQMEMPGGGVGNAIMTLGYDPRRKRFCGTWVGDMMANLWVYDGELDESGRVLSLYSEGPSFNEKGELSTTETSQYRDQIELHDDGYRTFSGSVKDANGQWQRFMLTHYRRVSGASRAEKAS